MAYRGHAVVARLLDEIVFIVQLFNGSEPQPQVIALQGNRVEQSLVAQQGYLRLALL